jgi:hypothetical protein
LESSTACKLGCGERPASGKNHPSTPAVCDDWKTKLSRSVSVNVIQSSVANSGSGVVHAVVDGDGVVGTLRYGLELGVDVQEE